MPLSQEQMWAAATDACDVAPPPMELIELPHRKTTAGETVTVLVRSAPPSTLAMLAEGFPVSNPNPDGTPQPPQTPEEQLALIGRFQQYAREIARVCVLKPVLSFDGPKPNAVDWESLSFEDQTAIVEGITRATGLNSDATKASRSFRGDDGSGRDDGAGADAAVQPADATASGDVPA